MSSARSGLRHSKRERSPEAKEDDDDDVKDATALLTSSSFDDAESSSRAVVGGGVGMIRTSARFRVVIVIFLFLCVSRTIHLLSENRTSSSTRRNSPHKMSNYTRWWNEKIQLLHLHVAKSGGGTFRERMLDLRIRSRFNVTYCHPNPCPPKVLQDPSSKRAIVTVRDPVDRFHSTFYWIKLLACRHVNETRIRDGRGAVWHPDVMCSDIEHQEYNVIFNVTSGDANQLAERMCLAIDSHSGDEEGKHAAHVDFYAIAFMRKQLPLWLPSPLNSTHIDVVSVILEKGFDLIPQLDASIEYMLAQKYGESEANATMNERRKALQERIKKKRTSIDPQRQDEAYEEEDSSRCRHSSRSSETPLSEKGTCCLTKYFSYIYDVFVEMRELTCKGHAAEMCRNAFSSILDRRAKYLANDYVCS